MSFSLRRLCYSIHGVRRALLCASLLAAVSCAKYSVIGKSGQGDRAHGPVPGIEGTEARGTPPKPPSAINAPPGIGLGFNQPILGDLDGDGFDDFLVQSSEAGDPSDIWGRPASTVYVFYGKTQFPPHVSIADADASIESDPIGAFALGDVNGDGLADFSVGRRRGFDIVFGSATRLAGHYTAGTAGVSWAAPTLPAPFSDGLQTLSAVRGAGDVNGDGIGDLLVTASQDGTLTTIQSNAGFGLLQVDYLVLGARGEWPPSTWDPSWAVAAIGHEMLHDDHGAGRDYLSMMRALPSGDLDADGYADLLAVGRDKLYVFYGGGTNLTGWVEAETADAVLRPITNDAQPFDTGFTSGLLMKLGDLDGDGASDLATYVPPALVITYGSKTRWSGEMDLQADLRVFLSNAAETSLMGAAAGDIDSDGLPDLVVMEGVYSSPNTSVGLSPQKENLYRVFGTGMRATGSHQLGAADAYELKPFDQPPAPLNLAYHGSGTLTDPPFATSIVSLAGDVDGDGSCEILTGHSDGETLEGESVGVYLIPSTPRIPD